MKTKTKLKFKKSLIFKIIALIVVVMSIYFFVLFIRLEILPIKLLILGFILLFLITFFVCFLLTRKHYLLRALGCLLSLILIICFAVGIHYQSSTIAFLENITALVYQTENYYVVVLANSDYTSLSDLDDELVSYVKDREGISLAISDLESNVNVSLTTKTDNSELINDFLDEEVAAIVIEENEFLMYEEMNSDLKENNTILTTITVQVKTSSNSKDVSITEESFNIYVTGIDTYGEISSVSRSDVNMVITVNPNTNQILITSIPRDYYVTIAGSTSTLNDKLTHAGLKGVETSIKTIENLLDIDINYYVKLNFTSLVEIIDAVGGVDVENPFEFTADYEEESGVVYYVFNEGTIHLDGQEALAYVRERYDLREGDIARTRHQQQVVTALINKLSSSTILQSYTDILNSIEGNFVTNMSLKNIKTLITYQLDNMPTWSVESQTLSGTDDSRKTASMPDLYSSVIIPDEESVNSAIETIHSLF